MKNYLVAEILSPGLPVPEGRRVPFEWTCIPIGPQSPVHPGLVWNQKLPLQKSARFRITVGIDVREKKRIRVLSREANKKLGEFDIRFVPVFQTFEIFLDFLR